MRVVYTSTILDKLASAVDRARETHQSIECIYLNDLEYRELEGRMFSGPRGIERLTFRDIPIYKEMGH